MNKKITRRAFAKGVAITATAGHGLNVVATAKPFGFEDCKYKLCNCDAEAQGYDTQTHALAATAAGFIDRRTAANKPLDESEIKLIVDTFTANAARSRASRDAAQHVLNVLAAPFLP